ncbi:hypothetical protein PAXRUDRAFT_177814, partial [Paxillus rubicundulus Ve08.2h10]
HHLPTQPTHQTANHKAADTSNPNTMCAGTTKPAGTSYGLLNRPKEVEGGKERRMRGQRASGSAAHSSDDNSRDEVCHTYVIPDSTHHHLPTRQTPERAARGGTRCMNGTRIGQWHDVNAYSKGHHAWAKRQD